MHVLENEQSLFILPLVVLIPLGTYTVASIELKYATFPDTGLLFSTTIMIPLVE